jgi:hypothetical protein
MEGATIEMARNNALVAIFVAIGGMRPSSVTTTTIQKLFMATTITITLNTPATWHPWFLDTGATDHFNNDPERLSMRAMAARIMFK